LQGFHGVVLGDRRPITKPVRPAVIEIPEDTTNNTMSATIAAPTSHGKVGSLLVVIVLTEQDKEALLEDYASLMPEALDGLDAAERHRVYKMLRVEAAVAPDGSLEVSGDVISIREMEPLSL